MSREPLVAEAWRFFGSSIDPSFVAGAIHALLDWLRQRAETDGARVYARGHWVDACSLRNLEDGLAQAPCVRGEGVLIARQLHIPLTRFDRASGSVNVRVPIGRSGEAEPSRVRVTLRDGSADRVAKSRSLQHELVELLALQLEPSNLALGGVRVVERGASGVSAVLWRPRELSCPPTPHSAEPLANGTVLRARADEADVRDVEVDDIAGLARWLASPAVPVSQGAARADIHKASYMLTRVAAPAALTSSAASRPAYPAPPVRAPDGPDHTADLPPPTELRQRLEAARVPFGRAPSASGPTEAPGKGTAVPPPPVPAPPVPASDAGGTEEVDMKEVRRKLRELGVIPFERRPETSDASPPSPPAPPSPALDATVAATTLPTLARFAEIQAAITRTNNLAGTLARFEMTEDAFGEVSRSFAKLMREAPAVKAEYERLYFEQLQRGQL